MSAFRSWDGAELVETRGGGVGRLWPANIRLRVYPQPHLEFGAANPKPVALTIAGEEKALEPGREASLALGLLSRAAARPVDLGDPRSPEGGIRVPRLGETVVFENGEEGLLRVEQPSAETVWVLSRDGALQERLQRRKFNDGGVLPFGWELFYEVQVEDLPGIERAPLAMAQQTPLQLEGGLSLGRPCYLSDHRPYLVAADLELDGQLLWSSTARSTARSPPGGRVALPAEPGRYDIDVGDGYLRDELRRRRARRTVRRAALPPPWQQPGAPGGRGMLTAGEADGLTVCGATVAPRYTGALPVLTRVRSDVQTISADGTLVAHHRPPTPAWFKEVGLDDGGRWEVFGDPVWLLTPPAGGRARDPAAARRRADAPGRGCSSPDRAARRGGRCAAQRGRLGDNPGEMGTRARALAESPPRQRARVNSLRHPARVGFGGRERQLGELARRLRLPADRAELGGAQARRRLGTSSSIGSTTASRLRRRPPC